MLSAYNHPMVGDRVRVESVQNATDQARNLANTLTGKKGSLSSRSMVLVRAGRYETANGWS